MNVKKNVKKIGALLTGATMVGATIMGAMADLSEYPAPFVQNGVMDAMLVIGADAKTSDTLGAIDIAASLQAAATVPAGTGGSVGTKVFSGDYVEFGKSNDLLEIGEWIGDVREVLTDTDLDMLAGGSISNDKGTTSYAQYLRFNIGTTGATGDYSGRVEYGKDEYDEVGDFLRINDSDFIFEYELEFSQGYESDLDSADHLEDFEDEIIDFFGGTYSIVDASVSGTSMTLDLLGGDVTDTLSDGETKTYTIDGVEYEVTAVFISTSPVEAMFSVNGVFTDTIGEGSTDKLSNGLEIGVRDIMTNDREGLVSFFLGANKISLTDTNYEDSSYYDSSSAVEVAEEGINNAQLKISGTNITSSVIEVTDIRYRLYANSVKGDIWVPPGSGVKEFVKEPEGFINPMWDVRYEGLYDVPAHELKFNAQGDDAYKLDFTSNEGLDYSIPFVDNSGSSTSILLGDEDDRLYFVEAASVTPVANYVIAEDSYLVFTDKNTETGFTRVLQWEDIDTDEKQMTFEDLAEGSKTATYTGTISNNGVNVTSPVYGELNVGGTTYRIYVTNTSTNTYKLAVDHNGDGDVASDEVNIIVKGGGIVDLGSTNSPGDTFVAQLKTLSSEFDENSGDEVINVTIYNRSSNEVGLGVTAGVTLFDLEDNDEISQGMSNYGVFFELNDPSGSDQAEELTIQYPDTQVGAQVVVTAGTVTSSQSGGSGGSAVVVNPAAVGIAVLDNEVDLGSGNLIVVGGPCVNTIAMELLDNPADCAEGFEPGKALIELFDSQNALLVAGYSAQDTLGAAYVLADYEDYDLSGTKVEVVVADLDSLTVQRVE